MDFEYTPEQTAAAQGGSRVRRRRRSRPTSWSGTRRRPSRSKWSASSASSATWARSFPEELGGAGLGYIEYSIIIEELSRVDGSVGIIVAAHTSLCSNHIYKMGTDEQRQRYLPKLASGEWIGCWSLTEPEAGSDAAGTRTTAVREGDCWVLNGAKTFTTNAHYADVCVAMAVTDRAAAQHGISAFIVEKGTPGFRAGKKENKLGLRASATGEVIFENCRLPATQLLGKHGEGFVDSLKVLDGGRISIAALVHRHGAGRLRRGAAVLQTAQAVRPPDLGVPGDPAQAGRYGDGDRRRAPAQLPRRAGCWTSGMRVTRESAMAKLFASEAAVRVANEAVQIHGGYGFIKDYPVEKFYRDVKLCTIGEGTSEIQRLVIARQLLKS